MYWKYEVACKEAGMDEDNINNLNRFFDRAKKKLKYENETMEKYSIQYCLISELEDAEYNRVMSIKDDSVNVEEEVLAELDKSKLLECLMWLEPDERELLVRYYWEGMSFRKLASEYGVALSTIQNRHDKIIEKLRYEMGVKADV